MPLLASLLGLAACDGALDHTPTPGNSAAPPGYAAEVLHAKEMNDPGVDDRIAAIQRRYGIEPQAVAKSPRSPENKGIDTVASALVAPPGDLEILYSEFEAPAAKGFRRTIYVRPGSVVKVNAYAFGAADPMLFLIRFDSIVFQSTGRLSSSSQNTFRIVAKNDDDGRGGLDSAITWEVGPQDGGYYMIVAAPYSNRTRGKVHISYVQVGPGGFEGYETPGFDGEPLVGGIVRSHAGLGANRYETTFASGVDPWLFVFKQNAMIGSTNDDNEGRNSVVTDLTFEPYDLVFLSAYEGDGTVRYQQGFASECKRVNAAGARRCVASRANGSVDMYLSNRDTQPWQERFTQKSHTTESNWCGPVAGENLLDWYGLAEPIEPLAKEMKTNAWGDFGTILEGCVRTCPNVGDVPIVGWIPGTDYVPTDPVCTPGCTTIASTVFSAITEAGTLPSDLKRVLDRRRPPGYRTVAGSQIGAEQLKQTLARGNPVIVLTSEAKNKLHWTVATGLFLDGAGVLRVQLANESISPTLAEFDEMTSLKRVGDYRKFIDNVGVVPTYYYWEREIELVSRQ